MSWAVDDEKKSLTNMSTDESNQNKKKQKKRKHQIRHREPAKNRTKVIYTNKT